MVDFSKLIAHTKGHGGKYDPLIDHLRDVAEMARSFAEKFNNGALAFWLGIFHDFGKINPFFQSYLKAMEENRSHPKVPHAVWGAAFMYHYWWGVNRNDVWKEFTLPISGHHAGLDAQSQASQKFSQFIRENPSGLQSMGSALVELQKHVIHTTPSLKITGDTAREMRIRMLFSALVDADYLATEKHFEPEKTNGRAKWPNVSKLWEQFLNDQEEMLKKADKNPKKVNRIRKEVYFSCLKAAHEKPGVFKMTVPTGGGKTRSGLAFALKHAVQNKLHRIIVALPYTSIIDQTASEYRKILEKDFQCVLEHHSQIEVPDEKEEQDQKHLRYRLASENWDVPLIVTTTVQLFESLFANKPGRVRKIHNITKSVIILDEVQTFPPQLLKPTLAVLCELVDNYGVSLVLSTATQPAFDNTPYLKAFQNLEIKEIVPDYPRHFSALRRVNYHFRREPIDWPELAEEVKGYDQIMVVLNTRKDALDLIAAMQGTPYIYHLSTLLCGQHRKDKLNEIRTRLNNVDSVRLISTQVVEAGVDLDFPVVYRAAGPLDRIVQAAGRCNREWSDPNRLGEVIIFCPKEGGVPGGAYFVGKTEAEAMLQKPGAEKMLHQPDIFNEYFQRLFSDMSEKLDEKGIQELRQNMNYPKVSEKYRLISDDTVPVVVKYRDSMAFFSKWQENPNQSNWRRLQPYLVNIYRWQTEAFGDWLHPVSEGSLFLWTGRYDDIRGIATEALDPADLIVDD
jgi:CRISPR-associated endonuclease/helicase Cas3